MKPFNTQAVVLAAGLGSRLEGSHNGLPKCLIEVGGKTLIRHHIEILNDLGIKEIMIVVGHGADEVILEVGDSGEIRTNEKYATTNSLYSLWLTRKWIIANLVVINADVLADPQIYRSLLAEDGNVLAFDPRSGNQDEEMKVQFKEGHLHAINKNMSPDNAQGEHLGLLKFNSEGAGELFAELERFVTEGRVNDWAPAAVNNIAQHVPIKGIDVSAYPWTEIDFPDDLRHAIEHVWPAIERRNSLAGADYPSFCRVQPHVPHHAPPTKPLSNNES